jgi:phosphotransferase system enzyme I (PtsI)
LNAILKSRGKKMIKGIGASPGIAIGMAFVKKDPEVIVQKKTIVNVIGEIEKFNAAIEKARNEIKILYENTLKTVGEEEAKIFEAHMMMLDDPEVFGKVREKIKAESVNAEWIIKEVTDMFVQIFESMEDQYLKERAADLKDVTNRVTRILLGVELVDLTNISEDVIIVSEDLTPSDTAQMNKEMVLGFITEIGGRTSHSVIMARTLEIPAVVAAQGIMKSVKTGDIIAFNGEEGIIVINPDEEIIAKFRKEREDIDNFKKSLESLRGCKTVSKDGFEVELVANIGTPKDVDGILRNDGEGVGLYRTEFLYMDRDMLPTEEEQFEAYKEVAEKLGNKPVIIRTLDIGGDKELPYLELPEEMNPFLGYRAIRLCLDRKDIFKTQLRALLRASAYGNIKIMFPMISSIEELREAKAILEEAKEELYKEDIPYNSQIEVGIMVEIPAVAVLSDIFAKEVDFFSIGTNDLIQYTTAVDRGNRKIAHLYNQFHPALLRLIKTVIENGHKEGIWVGMCGEVAGDPKLIPVLLGMGLDEFSMSPISILRARWIINNLSKKEMEEVVNKVINLPTASEVEDLLEKIQI